MAHCSQTPPPTPAQTTCFTDAAHYDVDGQVGGMITSVGSSSDCQAHCVSNPDCAHWSYQHGGAACYLFNLQATLVLNADGFTSGPKVCPMSSALHPHDDHQFLAPQ